MELEHARIASADKRTAVMEKAFDVLDAQDKRQFEYYKSNADQHHEARRQRLSFARKMASALFVVGAGVVALLLGMTFWGSDPQAAMALDMLKYVFVAVGGAGVLTAARATISFFMRGDDG